MAERFENGMRLALIVWPDVDLWDLHDLTAERLGLPLLRPADLLKDHVQSRTPQGIVANQLMDSGDAIPEELFLGMLDIRLSDPDVSAGYVMKNFPLTLVFSEGLDAVLSQRHSRLDMVVAVSQPDEQIVMRLGQRRLCDSCSLAIFVDGSESIPDPPCDNCGGALFRRPDDDPAISRPRLECFSSNVAPVLNRYAAIGRLVRLEAPEATAGDTEQELAELICASVSVVPASR